MTTKMKARLAALLPALALAASGPAGAATPAPPELGADTVWEGTVDVARDVRVMRGATLLIRPGTTVRFGTAKDAEGQPVARIVVNGTLIAQGTSGEPVEFTSAAADPRAGDWGGVILDKANERPSRLSHVRIRFAATGLSLASSAIVADDLEVRDCGTGVQASQESSGMILRGTMAGNEVGVHYHQSSGPGLEDCSITGNRQAGVACILSSSPVVRFCVIADSGSGVHCVQGSSPLIEASTIRGCARGIFMELQSRPRIVRNAITGNGAGIWGEKMVFPAVAGNVISGNEVGVYCNYSAYPELHGNSIVDNRSFGIVLGDNMSIVMEKQLPYRYMGQFFFKDPPEESRHMPAKSQRFLPFAASEEGIVDARGNWWGAAAAGEMARLGEKGNISVIEDFFDKPDTWYEDKTYRRDRVAFAPWETEPPREVGPPEKPYAGIRGKVVSGGKPVAGARVHVYGDADDGLRGAGALYSAPTDRDGAFSLTLAPGTWFIAAKSPDPPFPWADPGEGAWFGYYGGNPVVVGPGAYQTVNIQAARRKPITVSPREGAERGLVEGVVLGPDGPVEGALVHVYHDASRQFRGPDLFGPQGAVPGGTGADGAFSFELPAGAYFLVASKRKGGSLLGPLQTGDLYGWFDGNPLVVAPATGTRITLQIGEKLRDTVAAPAAAGKTGIRGTVRGPSGGAPKGVYAFATTDPSFMIGGMPPFRSQTVAEDGSYFIEVPGGKTYYVSARSGYGGPPLPGEWHGFHGEKTPRPVPVEPGSVVGGIDIVVRKME